MIKPVFLKGKDEQEIKDLKISYAESALFRERLAEILEKDIDTSLKQMKDAARGNVYNLTEFYAEELARQQAYDDVINLIK